MNHAPLDPTSASLRPSSLHVPAQFDGDDPTWAIAAAGRRPATESASLEPNAAVAVKPTKFWPEPPQTLDEAGLRPSQVEALVLKFLLNLSVATGREIASQIALPFGLVQKLLFSMKEQQLVSLKGDGPLGDYAYELTNFGVEHARSFAVQCTYFGAAPVSLDDYTASVSAQSVTHQSLTLDRIRKSFHDLVIHDDDLTVIGEALNLGRGMFLHGAPGNGKSSVGERITRVFDRHVWIPRAISVGGEILRLFDSMNHQPADDSVAQSLAIHPFDRRWVLIRRPTIVMGGELELDAFDIATNSATKINEAPLQLKANCGTLVVDDFGRNRFRPSELLNRLVVPMERGVDSFHLSSGRTFKVPFECMLVFASNDVPADIVDEAFLRRIPFKIAMRDPDEGQFKAVYRVEAESLGLETSQDDAEYLLQRHYREPGRPMRFCHPRDLLRMIANACEFQGRPLVVTRDDLDRAVGRYVSLKTSSAS